jgi:MFS transporter, AAHS family, benzoate transport protein
VVTSPPNSRTRENPPARTRSGLIVLALCFLTVAADGYDLIVYGASVLQLLYEPGWDITPSTAGAIASWTLVGMMVGFVCSGHITDRIGRRKVITVGIVWFSIGSVACAFAQSPEFLMAVRFLAGIGLGGVIPSAVVLTAEFAPRYRRQLYIALMLTGFSVGGILAAVVALAVLPHNGWRALFAIGGLFVLIAPATYLWLPESPHHLALRAKTVEARTVAQRHRLDFDDVQAEHDAMVATHAHSGDGTVHSGYRLLLSRRLRTAALIFTLVCFCSQFTLYGLNTWLPEMMHGAGYPVGPSLQFFLVLQVSAVIGMVGGSLLADRLGTKPVIIAFFLAGALSLVALSWRVDTGLLVAAVAGTGLGTAGTTMLLYGYASTHFPVPCRGTAVGASMGLARLGAILGPMIGGWIIGSTLSQDWSFYAYAIPLGIGAVVVALVSRHAGTTPTTRGAS